MKDWTVFFVFALAGLTGYQAVGKPNILLIMADDMGYECVTANGGESYSTPNLYRLGKGGMRFEHCYAQPICTPSRVQLMTGIYNQRNYIRFVILDPTVTTFGVESILNGKVVIGAKGRPIDAGNHVPFIANWPGTIPAGRVNRDLVDFSDFLPTICDTIDASVPSSLKIDGRSFIPQLHGKTGDLCEWTYCWYSRNGGMKGDEYTRTQRYKLHRDGRFIDVANDPFEVKPLDIGKLGGVQLKTLVKLQKVLAEKKGTRTKFDLEKHKNKK